MLVTQVNLPSLEHDLELVQRAKQEAPGLRVILVGATAKWFKERILRDGVADVVMEEAEELLVSENVAAFLSNQPEELQGCHVLRGGSVVTLPARERMKSLDFVDFPAYELLDFNRYESDYYLGRRYRYATVFTTKGCPYRCGYCPYPYGFGRKLIYRSPERVGADIERLRREFGVEQILFRDQVFTINPKHAQAVCEELIRRDLGVVWVCETRYDLVGEELLQLMYRAGCREVHFGLESGDEAMFAQVAKSDGPQSLDLFERAIGWARDAGMRVHLHCIVGMPDESWQSVRNTTRFLRRTKPDSVQLAYFVPYPGTPFFDELSKSGELGDLGKLDWEDLGSFTGPVLPSRHMSTDEIQPRPAPNLRRLALHAGRPRPAQAQAHHRPGLCPDRQAPAVTGQPARRLAGASIAFLNNQGLAAIGGGVTILRQLVAALAPDYGVTVLSYDQPGAAPDGVRQIALSPPPPAPGPLWRVAPFHRARQLARGAVPEALQQADLVVALDCHFAGHAAPGAAAAADLSLAVLHAAAGVVRRLGRSTPGLSFLQYAWLERRMARLADRVVVASEAHAAEMRRYEAMAGFRPLVLHPVFPAAAEPVPRAGRDGTVTVLSAGRLEPGKNFGAVLDLAARLRDLPCRFVIAGGGPELGRLQAKAEALGVGDRVTFAGPVAGLDGLLAEADLFLHTSLYESFGIAPFEAMRAGVPPILAEGAVVGCREVMQDGMNSLFVDLSRPESAAASLRHLILDRSARERMGEAARTAAAQVLAQDYAARFRAAIEEMLAAETRP